VVHAQVPVRGFYEKLGFAAYGEVYEEAGIPHISMERFGDTVPLCKEYK
jgi:predicted GNAT family N-acyltransferase